MSQKAKQKKKERNSIPIFYHAKKKINLKVIKYLNTRPEALKLIEKNPGKAFKTHLQLRAY